MGFGLAYSLSFEGMDVGPEDVFSSQYVSAGSSLGVITYGRSVLD